MTTPYYNVTNVTSTFDFITMTTEVNRLANGLIGALILISLFLLIFINSKVYETKRSFAFASWITTIVSILFYGLGFVQLYMVVICVLASIGGLIGLISENG